MALLFLAMALPESIPTPEHIALSDKFAATVIGLSSNGEHSSVLHQADGTQTSTGYLILHRDFPRVLGHVLTIRHVQAVDIRDEQGAHLYSLELRENARRDKPPEITLYTESGANKLYIASELVDVEDARPFDEQSVEEQVATCVVFRRALWGVENCILYPQKI